MTGQIIYTPENPPTKGVAKKIWDVLVANNLDPQDLHYNGGRRGVGGGGTWACELGNPEYYNYTHDYFGNFCGILGKTLVYIQGLEAPYDVKYIGFTTRKCPFRNRTGCSYYSSTNKDALQENDCPATCDAGTDEFLIQRNEEYERVKKN